MRNTSITITVPHLLSPISVFSTESKSYIIALCFNVLETLQINQSNFHLTFLNNRRLNNDEALL